MKPTLKAPGSKRLKPKCDERERRVSVYEETPGFRLGPSPKCDHLLSNFAFNFNLRRYSVEADPAVAEMWWCKAALQGGAVGAS